MLSPTLHEESTLVALADLEAATHRHRKEHGCEAYGFADGPALTRLAKMHRPRRILELGTALGYTACCLAMGAGNLAHVDTVEGDDLHAHLAVQQIVRHGFADRVAVHAGRFDDVLSRLEAGYDMAFFDGYAPPPTLIQRVRALLCTGGILICSNLQLGTRDDARLLATDLNDPLRWTSLTPIESGRTLVLAKLGMT